MKRTLLRLGWAGMTVALLAGCAVPQSPTPTPLPTHTSAPLPTQTPPPTVASIPTRAAATPSPAHTPAPIPAADAFAFAQNQRLGRGVNFGNALEAPTEGEWGVTLEEAFFPIIQDGGFDSVRVPIRWNAHALADAPYTIEPAFFERVDWVVKNALQHNLVVILDLHHYDELMEKTQENEARFLAIWDQIARHYQNQPDSVYFELLNEPNGSISTGSAWNELIAKTIPVIRASNPSRTIIVGPGDWYSINRLFELSLPEAERNLIVSFHYYQPFHFTHQGAEWVENSDPWLGTTWKGTTPQRGVITRDLDTARHWSELKHRPITMGEFGAYSKADMPSRALWTDFLARDAEQHGFSWAYWEFCAGFGVYDRATQDWVQPLHQALIP